MNFIITSCKNSYRKLVGVLDLKKRLSPLIAYNLWAPYYDSEIDNGNITVLYNDYLVLNILHKLDLKNKIICDFGARTGRYYKTIKNFSPKKYIACDISPKMLECLKIKYPNTQTYLIKNNSLDFASNGNIDIVFSALTIGYVKNLKHLLAEWTRILKPEGEIIITMLHPNFSTSKYSRSFKSYDKKIKFIKSYSHKISDLIKLFNAFNLKVKCFEEESIDERSIELLESIQKTSIYETLRGQKIVCGFILKLNKSSI